MRTVRKKRMYVSDHKQQFAKIRKHMDQQQKGKSYSKIRLFRRSKNISVFGVMTSGKNLEDLRKCLASAKTSKRHH